MKSEIILDNKYFPWNKDAGEGLTCWLKGDLYYQDKLMDCHSVRTLFLSLRSPFDKASDALKTLLLHFNGSYALVIETSGTIFCMVDRIRSIPLFYAETEAVFIISDDANYIQDRIKSQFDYRAGAEFLVTGFVTGSNTLFHGISQIQAGECLYFSREGDQITVSRYHHFLHEDFYTYPEEILLRHLDDVVVGVFQRLVTSIQAKCLRVVVPLSGGLDSRLIVAMLKRLGVDDVICFSYGRKGNYEARISKQIAEALGYRWYFVEYTDKRWYDCYRSDDMRNFERYSGNLVSLPHIQDFLAVQILRTEGIIPENAVFLPGHGGMLFGGSTPEYVSEMTHNFDQFVKLIFSSHFGLCRWQEIGSEKLDSFFREKVRESVGEMRIYDDNSLSNALELFNFQERQAKFLTNSVRTYEYLGYRWMVPLWDSELINFFLKTEINFRCNKNLYHTYVLNFLIARHVTVLKPISSSSTIKTISFSSPMNLYFILQKARFLRYIARKLSWPYLAAREYFFNIFNWYAIMSKREFIASYTGMENINRYLSKNYLKNMLQIKNPDNLLRNFK